ncbi:unnamed protein product [Rotaria socialis]|uniref:Protein kinase domain-containing protein n=1 Tax=Rotaria socialis TaxID=392032 RepID=A0A818CBL4_9BILA|nr:unnamed protein product [Rotaria socialis]CAF3352975.1 unnamed protein product [Rotaria socialis]CAF3429750.1 unnamed protein product [Rotaria socialis]CAF3430041.1 unnamed protein product [Rotaria socialis]
MIPFVLFVCLTNVPNVPSSNMNNSSFSANNTNNHDDKKDTPQENIKDILNVILNCNENEDDDELTPRNGSELEALSEYESISNSSKRPVDSESASIFPASTNSNSQLNLRIIDFNDLHIGDMIGVGGFGHVFHGKFGNIDVAIKTAKSLASFCSIQTTPACDDTSDAVKKTLIDSLLREARLFSNLKHRNIIQLFGVSPSLSTKNLYLVMEYAYGGALNYLLRRRQLGLYPNVFIEYAKQIADGMKYLHEEACEHIIHRDLKCSNILIFEHINDVHNENDLLQKTLKITDFGLARKQLQSSSVSTAGTFAWMSPECIRNTEFSTKSDVWSFGVLLWECLTGEVPYKGFDQMQVAFGIATNKYSLPIPSTCPEEFSQLMTNCWKVSPHDRPTFSELLEQINAIIEINYMTNGVNHMEPNEESYQSLQKDWREEIQDMFKELKDKEQEIRDREQAIHQRLVEQNNQRLQLEKWEHELYQREMHIVELELQLLIAKNNQQRTQHHTPKTSNKSGGFFRSILNGNSSQSSGNNTSISSPTNFRHLISVCYNQPITDQTFSPNNSAISPSFSSSISCQMPPNSAIKSSIPEFNRSISSNSTPTTPNMSRLRTLTFNHLVDGSNPPTSPEKPPRSISQSKSSGRKSKSSSLSAIKRKYGKAHSQNGDPEWYLENLSRANTNNNNNNNNDNNTAISSAMSTPTIDRPSQKLVSGSTVELIDSSSSSLCSTPNDRSLARAFLDINSMLVAVGLGRRIPIQVDPSSIRPIQHPSLVLHSSNETVTIRHPTETNTPSAETLQANELLNVDYRSEPFISPIRPNSLVLTASQSSSQKSQILRPPSIENQHMTDDENEKYYSAQSSKISTPMINSMDLATYKANFEDKLKLSSLLDIDKSEEQKKHQTKSSTPKNETHKIFHHFHHVLKNDFLH